jgi:hypothetical protein
MAILLYDFILTPEQRLLEDGAEVRPGYTLEYCALTSMDLHGAILQATLQAAARD